MHVRFHNNSPSHEHWEKRPVLLARQENEVQAPRVGVLEERDDAGDARGKGLGLGCGKRARVPRV